MIPAVATGNQFKSALGNPQKILQRVMVSSIGGVITLLISQSQVASQFYALWLILGVMFLLYILWGPIIEAGQINSRLRVLPFICLFEGEVSNIKIKEKVEERHEQANQRGELELIENRRTWMFLEISDEDGYIGTLRFPLEKKFQQIRAGQLVRCLVFSDRKDFSHISATSDAWLPQLGFWIGEYPYLLRPAFEDLCQFKLSRRKV